MPAAPPVVNQYQCVTAGPPYRVFQISGGAGHSAEAWQVPYGISITPGASTSPEVVTEGTLAVPIGTIPSLAGPLFCDTLGNLTGDASHGYCQVGWIIGSSGTDDFINICIRQNIRRSSPNVRPVVISDLAPFAHQATDAEMTALGLTP